MPRALVVEDDERTARRLAELLALDGVETQIVADGEDGLRAAAAGAFDLLILDRMLPRTDGLTIVRRLRAADVSAPVLFLSALGQVVDRVEGLDGGADDYLAKPFADEEFRARARSLLRRPANAAQEVLLVGDIEIRVKARTVHRGGKHIPTSRKEFELIRCLAENAGEFVPRRYLLEKVWNLHFDPQTNVVDVHVSRLRRKLDEGFARPSIVAARGEGYRLDGGDA